MNIASRVVPQKRPKVLVLNAKMYRDRIHDFDELVKEDPTVPHIVVAPDDNALTKEDPHTYWLTLAKLIRDAYDTYDGFVVMQDIDTMCSTASMLSFLLENLGKSIALTGAVTQTSAAHSDWRRNFVLSALYAAGTLPGAADCCEVVVVFAERVFRGTRAILESSSRMQPFSTPQFPPLAEMRGHRLQIQPNRYLRAPTGRLVAHTDMQLAEILLLTVTPSCSREALMRLVVHSRAKALVILAFGAGNVPYRDQTVIAVAHKADAQGMVVVVSSQVRRGAVELGMYYTGGPLAKVAISAGDMTVEATVAKLKYLIGVGWGKQDVKHLMGKSLRGELTDTNLQSNL